MSLHLHQQLYHSLTDVTLRHLFSRQATLQSIQATFYFICDCLIRLNIFKRLRICCPLKLMYLIFYTVTIGLRYLMQGRFINQCFYSHLLQKNNRLAANVFIIIVMSQQTAQYFNRFYHLLLRQHLTDPAIHSEWLYFQSMFKTEPLDNNRLELYLGILTNEKNKKQNLSNHNINQDIQSHNIQLKNKLKTKNNNDNTIINNDLKFEKRHSENWKPQLTSLQFKMTPDPLHLRKISCVEEESNRYSRQSLQCQSKSFKNQRQQPTFNNHNNHSNNLNNYFITLGLNPINSEIKEEKETKNNDRQKKLSQLSGKMIKLFQNHQKLRA